MTGRHASLCAPLFLIGCQSAADLEPPRVSLADIRLLPSGLLEQRFELDLRITNPNNVDVPLDGLSFNLVLNDAQFADGVSNPAFVVPRLGDVVVPIEARTTLLHVVEQVIALADAQALTYRLQGTAFLRGIARDTIPFESEGALRLAPESLRRTMIPRAIAN